jgi:hypothetical protein
VANAFNNSSVTITGKLNIQQIEKGDADSIIKDSFPGNFPNLKIIAITEAAIKSTMNPLKPKKSSGNDEITNKTLKACATCH